MVGLMVQSWSEFGTEEAWLEGSESSLGEDYFGWVEGPSEALMDGCKEVIGGPIIGSHNNTWNDGMLVADRIGHD